MNRNVTALYETKAQAEQARDALKAAHLDDHVEIHDHDSAKAHGGVMEWLSGLFGDHDDRHVYDEGLRRSHFLLTVKVDDLNEIRAAEILDTVGPVNLDQAQATWRRDGWNPASGYPAAFVNDSTAPDTAKSANIVVPYGTTVRIYDHVE